MSNGGSKNGLYHFLIKLTKQVTDRKQAFASDMQVGTGVTSYGHWGTYRTPLKLVHVHQSGNFYLRITPVGEWAVV